VKGRESRSNVKYDYVSRRVDYHFKGETFFLRRLRVVDDTVPMPEGVHIDDAISATLNYADKLWPPQSDGNLSTHIIRRKVASNEGPDDVQARYQAELVPFTLNVAVDADTRKPVGDSISRASRRGRSRISPPRSRSASTGGPNT